MYNLYNLFQFSGDAMQILLHKLQICSHVTASQVPQNTASHFISQFQILVASVRKCFTTVPVGTFPTNMQYLRVKETDAVYFLKSSFLTVANCFSSLGSNLYTKHHTSRWVQHQPELHILHSWNDWSTKEQHISH
jgi:hypothetical protein